jgi:phenylalanyl-tRNA synthetase alpha chain
MSTVESARAELEAALGLVRDSLAEAKTADAARAAAAQLLGKKGALARLEPRMKEVGKEERPALGKALNEARKAGEALLAERLAAIDREARRAALAGPPFDLTLPGRGLGIGSLHPVRIMEEEVLAALASLGFENADGPEVELEKYNFDLLGFPPDHPATDMQDSFFVQDGVVLRTHTSPVQIREMLSHPPPVRIACPGVVYRRDDDVTHSPMFHQIEGLLVDAGVSLADMKGVMTLFLRRVFGPDAPVRFRPSYFPFVEPGAEVDVGCTICGGKAVGCRVCKESGFLELGGCGMVHPVVFENVGYDPERWTGFAFGMGIDRIAMLRFGIPDIRMLYENDVRLLGQL